MGCNKNYCLLIYVIPLLLLALAAFGGTLVIAIFGIAKASESNPCITTNGSTNCVAQMSLLTPDGGSAGQMNVVNDGENEFLLWMAGATACGVLFAIICTLALWALEDAARRIRKQKPKSQEGEMIELDNKGDATDGHRSPTPEPQPEVIGNIGKYKVVKKEKSEIRPMSLGSLIALFCSCFFGILSLLCLLWAIAIGVNHSRRTDITVTPFIIVELLVAIGFPFLLFTAGVFMANVLDFITFGAVDARKGLQRFLKSVKFEEGTNIEEQSNGGDPNKKDYDFWVIEDTFYFYLEKRKREDRVKKGFCFSCYPNFATWVLVAILSLSINLAVSYFADITLDMQISVNSCTDPRIDRTFSCFNSSTLIFVDCVNDINVELIHCFKFYRFGVDVDLIQSLATSYAFYLVATSIFAHLFGLMKISLYLSNKRVWGVVVVVIGILLFIVSVIIILVWLSGYVSPALGELSRLNVINLSQFVMVSWFVILIGLLMIGGTWAEKEKVRGKKSTSTAGKAAASGDTPRA